MSSTQSIFTCCPSLHRLLLLVSMSWLINCSMQPNSILAKKAWSLVLKDLQFFVDHGNRKKMYFDEVSFVLWHRLITDHCRRTDGHPSLPKVCSPTAQMPWLMSRMNMWVLLVSDTERQTQYWYFRITTLCSILTARISRKLSAVA